jgi:hypothetical protein
VWLPCPLGGQSLAPYERHIAEARNIAELPCRILGGAVWRVLATLFFFLLNNSLVRLDEPIR